MERYNPDKTWKRVDAATAPATQASLESR